MILWTQRYIIWFIEQICCWSCCGDNSAGRASYWTQYLKWVWSCVQSMLTTFWHILSFKLTNQKNVKKHKATCENIEELVIFLRPKLVRLNIIIIINLIYWTYSGDSSVGRASDWRSQGHVFDQYLFALFFYLKCKKK